MDDGRDNLGPVAAPAFRRAVGPYVGLEPFAAPLRTLLAGCSPLWVAEDPSAGVLGVGDRVSGLGVRRVELGTDVNNRQAGFCSSLFVNQTTREIPVDHLERVNSLFNRPTEDCDA